MKVIKDLLISSILFVLIDSIYLSFFAIKFFKPLIKRIQSENLKINLTYAIFCYIILIAGLNYFIISRNKSEFEAFILGSFVYGVFETTNGAIFKTWDIGAAVTDTLWGGILFSTVTFLTKKIKKLF